LLKWININQGSKIKMNNKKSRVKKMSGGEKMLLLKSRNKWIINPKLKNNDMLQHLKFLLKKKTISIIPTVEICLLYAAVVQWYKMFKTLRVKS